MKYTNRINKFFEVTGDMPAQTRWLLSVMNTAGINVAEFSSKLHMSRTSVYRFLRCENELSYIEINAIINVFQTNDDPDEVMHMIWDDRGKMEVVNEKMQ